MVETSKHVTGSRTTAIMTGIRKYENVAHPNKIVLVSLYTQLFFFRLLLSMHAKKFPSLTEH